MATDLDTLITPVDEDEALSTYLENAASVGFPTTAWQSGGVAYTLLRLFAKATVDFIAMINAIAKGGLLDLSTGLWLTLLAAQIFRLTRYTATFATGSVRLAIASGYSGQTFQPGQLWIKTGGGLRYNSFNSAPVTIAAGASAVVPFRAESTGARYNVALGTSLQLVTPFPGLTAAFENVGDGTPWTVQGSDDEADEALRIRCRSKWALLGIDKTRDAYVHLAMDVPGVGTQPNRVAVDDQNPRGPNTVNIWLAGPSGPLPGADVTLINTYIQARKSPSSDIQVAAAVARPITVAATVLRVGGFAQASAQAAAAVTATIQNLPLAGVVRLAQAEEDIMGPDGVVDCTGLTLNGSAANIQLAANEVATVAAVNLTDVVQN